MQGVGRVQAPEDIFSGGCGDQLGSRTKMGTDSSSKTALVCGAARFVSHRRKGKELWARVKTDKMRDEANPMTSASSDQCPLETTTTRACTSAGHDFTYRWQTDGVTCFLTCTQTILPHAKQLLTRECF